MLQNILPSLISFLISLPLLFIFRNDQRNASPRIGKAFFYHIIYIILIFLPITYVAIAVPDSTMNWSGKLLAIAFSIGFYSLFRTDFKTIDFINFRPDRNAQRKVLIVGIITLVSMCLLTIIFSKTKPLNIEKLLYQATMPGLDEELWRAILLGLLIPLIKDTKFKLGHPAVWITTILFALNHSLYIQGWEFGFALDAFIITGILGYILGWTILKTKSFLPAFTLHNLINFSSNFLEMAVL